MWNIIGWAVFGGLTGWIAAVSSQKVSVKDVARIISVGVLGGVFGGFGGSRIVPETSSEMIFGSMMTAVCVSTIAIAVSERVVKSKLLCQQRNPEGSDDRNGIQDGQR